jgi:hypothetical protein
VRSSRPPSKGRTSSSTCKRQGREQAGRAPKSSGRLCVALRGRAQKASSRQLVVLPHRGQGRPRDSGGGSRRLDRTHRQPDKNSTQRGTGTLGRQVAAFRVQLESRTLSAPRQSHSGTEAVKLQRASRSGPRSETTARPNCPGSGPLAPSAEDGIRIRVARRPG